MSLIVQRYLAFAGVFGRPAVWNYHLLFTGGLRNGSEDPWMRISASQQSFVEPPARLFLIESSKFGLPFSAFYNYVGSQATFKVWLAGLVTVVNSDGPQMNQSETVTLLNDMLLLAPATLVDPAIRWEELDR